MFLPKFSKPSLRNNPAGVRQVDRGAKSLIRLSGEPWGHIRTKFRPHFPEKVVRVFLLGLFAGAGDSTGDEKGLTALFAVSP